MSWLFSTSGRAALESRTETKTPIFVIVSYVSGNQVKSLWPLAPFSSTDFCQRDLCELETRPRPPALIELIMVKDTEPSLSQKTVRVCVHTHWSQCVSMQGG